LKLNGAQADEERKGSERISRLLARMEWFPSISGRRLAQYSGDVTCGSAVTRASAAELVVLYVFQRKTFNDLLQRILALGNTVKSFIHNISSPRRISGGRGGVFLCPGRLSTVKWIL